MAPVTVTAARHQDGWLTVDTTDWLAARAEHNPDLTDALADWLGDRIACDSTLTEWLKRHFGHEPTGLYGEDAVFSTFTGNYDTLLADDIGYVFARVGEHRLLIVNANDRAQVLRVPQVYDYTCGDDYYALDTGTAYGSCAAGHRYFVESGVRMTADNAGITHSVGNRIRVPFGDTKRGYVACPDCGRSVHFQATTD